MIIINSSIPDVFLIQVKSSFINVFSKVLLLRPFNQSKMIRIFDVCVHCCDSIPHCKMCNKFWYSFLQRSQTLGTFGMCFEQEKKQWPTSISSIGPLNYSPASNIIFQHNLSLSFLFTLFIFLNVQSAWNFWNKKEISLKFGEIPGNGSLNYSNIKMVKLRF